MEGSSGVGDAGSHGLRDRKAQGRIEVAEEPEGVHEDGKKCRMRKICGRTPDGTGRTSSPLHKTMVLISGSLRRAPNPRHGVSTVFS